MSVQPISLQRIPQTTGEWRSAMCTRMVGPLLGLLSIVILLIHASAQPAAAAYRPSEENRNACTPDVFRLCSKLIPDATPGCRAVFTSPSRQ
jgi:hypothetical protein